jgi:hypothetical protein
VVEGYPGRVVSNKMEVSSVVYLLSELLDASSAESAVYVDVLRGSVSEEVLLELVLRHSDLLSTALSFVRSTEVIDSVIQQHLCKLDSCDPLVLSACKTLAAAASNTLQLNLQHCSPHIAYSILYGLASRQHTQLVFAWIKAHQTLAALRKASNNPAYDTYISKAMLNVHNLILAPHSEAVAVLIITDKTFRDENGHDVNIIDYCIRHHITEFFDHPYILQLLDKLWTCPFKSSEWLIKSKFEIRYAETIEENSKESTKSDQDKKNTNINVKDFFISPALKFRIRNFLQIAYFVLFFYYIASFSFSDVPERMRIIEYALMAFSFSFLIQEVYECLEDLYLYFRSLDQILDFLASIGPFLMFLIRVFVIRTDKFDSNSKIQLAFLCIGVLVCIVSSIKLIRALFALIGFNLSYLSKVYMKIYFSDSNIFFQLLYFLQ